MWNLLDGGAEMARINTFIEQSAKPALSDISFLGREIAKFKQSQKRKEMIDGERYYLGGHDILRRQRKVIGANGILTPVQNLPNNRIVDNQYAKLVDQKVNYFLGKPLTIDTKNERYHSLLKEIFHNKFLRVLKNVCEDCFNNGIGWLHPYYDEKGVLCFKRFKPSEIIPFWQDTEHTILDGAIRIFPIEVYRGTTETIVERVEVYDKDGIHYYILNGASLLPDKEHRNTTYLTLWQEGKEKGFNWNRIPLIAFKYNNQEIPLIKRVKTIQDSINTVLSDFQNNMQEDARNTILVLKNYDGQNLEEFRYNLAQYGVVKVKSIDGFQGDVTTLTVNVNAENYKSLLDLLKRSMIENGRGYDVQELKSSGSPNEMSIKAIFNDIDMDSNGMETEFQASLEDLLWFINLHFSNTGQGSFEKETVNFIFNKDMVVNESQTIIDCKNSMGILSNETIISQHPWIKDTDAELKKLNVQEEKSMEKFAGYEDFGNLGGGVDSEIQ